MTRYLLHISLCLMGMYLASPTPASAQLPFSAAGAALRAGSLGGGVEVATPLLPNLNLRLGVTGATFSYDTDYSGNDYELDLNLLTLSALGDYHLLGGGFRVTGGSCSTATVWMWSAHPAATRDH